jgi:LysR family glycine cleavage system transcriptional activator
MAMLPPLNSLRAFEAVGRYLSFSKAAGELNVTPGAISQQVRGLEDFLEIKLFKRRNRSIVLTDSGQVFLPLLSDGFAGIAAAVDSVRRSQGDEPLTISAAPSFTAKWLIPRLCKFQALHPEIDVRIDASSRLVDFAREDIDVGIRFGTGEVEGLDSIYLFSYDLIPVCSPDLMHEGKAVHDLSDIRHHTLLHSQDTDFDPSFPDWAMWLATAGVDDVDASRGMFFSQGEMVIEAAIEGQGIALGASVMVAGAIESGRLVQPFETRLPVRLSFHLITTRQKWGNPKISAFRQWILDESVYLRESESVSRNLPGLG